MFAPDKSARRRRHAVVSAHRRSATAQAGTDPRRVKVTVRRQRVYVTFIHYKHTYLCTCVTDLHFLFSLISLTLGLA